MKKFKDRALIRTITGKNKTGQKLNKILPLRNQRDFIVEVFKGGKDVLPFPQAKDASIVQDAAKIKELVDELPADIEKIKEDLKTYPEIMAKKLYSIKDLLDDGRLNDSAEGLSPETKFKIRMATSILLFTGFGYQVLAMIFGWPQIPLFDFVGV